nr:MAG TPA_asm: hypothetical protein [Caudoviricetes sp.]
MYLAYFKNLIPVSLTSIKNISVNILCNYNKRNILKLINSHF